MKNSLKNMVLTLSAITLVGSAAVGGAYRLTKEPIARAKVEKTNSAIREVVPTFDNDPSSEITQKEIDGETVKIYTARKGDQVCGYAVESFSKEGFSGKIVVMVGLRPDGTIHSTTVVEQRETPGLGDKMDRRKSDFALQFDGVNPSEFNLAVKKDGGDVDAITAATISSRAFTDAVQRACKVVAEYKVGKEQTP